MEIFVCNRGGEVIGLEPDPGRSLMQVLRDAGYDELMALCGGQRSCATCHVYVDAEHFDLLPPMGEEESELLELSDHRAPTSRLSCQLRFEPALAGMTLTIAPDD